VYNSLGARALLHLVSVLTTVAITGGTGFIGRALVDCHLQHGDRVRLLTRRPDAAPNGTIPFEGDLTRSVPSAFADGADVVYHIAAELHDRSRMEEVNVRGTSRLLKAAVGRCGRWVQLSSVGVYGPPDRGEDITESTRPRPANHYERTKLQADQMVERLCRDAACPWVILRPSNVVGATMRNQSAFGLVKSVVSGRFVFVGSRDSMSTYVHVEDVVAALRALACAPSETIINLSSDCPWQQLVERICVRARCAPPRVRVPFMLARAISRTLGRIPGFPLSPTRFDALARRGGYPVHAALRLPGFRLKRPMPEGFDEITDRALTCGSFGRGWSS
jgi:nucleoside-diphosphate-sugar epimerase